MSEHIFPTDGRSVVYVTKTEGISSCETALEEIIRCRDCKRSLEKGWKCTYWAQGRWDATEEADVIELADVRPDGYCFKAERREA